MPRHLGFHKRKGTPAPNIIQEKYQVSLWKLKLTFFKDVKTQFIIEMYDVEFGDVD